LDAGFHDIWILTPVISPGTAFLASVTRCGRCCLKNSCTAYEKNDILLFLARSRAQKGLREASVHGQINTPF
jgi:hypothetical protein